MGPDERSPGCRVAGLPSHDSLEWSERLGDLAPREPVVSEFPLDSDPFGMALCNWQDQGFEAFELLQYSVGAGQVDRGGLAIEVSSKSVRTLEM